MTYLELSPAITALRTRPEEFEFRDNGLHHLGSRHTFRFLSDDEVRIEAVCDCSLLRARPEQSRALREAFRQWHATYWRPLEINREFAEHFAPPGFVRRTLMALLRWLIAWRPAPRPAPIGQVMPVR
jgi:hypothetical protein